MGISNLQTRLPWSLIKLDHGILETMEGYICPCMCLPLKMHVCFLLHVIFTTSVFCSSGSLADKINKIKFFSVGNLEKVVKGYSTPVDDSVRDAIQSKFSSIKTLRNAIAQAKQIHKILKTMNHSWSLDLSRLVILFEEDVKGMKRHEYGKLKDTLDEVKENVDDLSIPWTDSVRTAIQNKFEEISLLSSAVTAAKEYDYILSNMNNSWSLDLSRLAELFEEDVKRMKKIDYDKLKKTFDEVKENFDIVSIPWTDSLRTAIQSKFEELSSL